MRNATFAKIQKMWTDEVMTAAHLPGQPVRLHEEERDRRQDRAHADLQLRSAQAHAIRSSDSIHPGRAASQRDPDLFLPPMRHLASYILTRFLLAIPMVFIMLTIVFVVLRVMPGDPVSAMLGDHAPQRVIEQKKQELGLNKPIAVQYVDYLGKLARLDLGDSMIFKQKVSQPIIEKLPATIELTLFGLLVSLGLGIPLGAAAARRRRSGGDFGIRLYANVVYCIPVFWMGLLLQLFFGVWLGWFPISGAHQPARGSLRVLEDRASTSSTRCGSETSRRSAT